MAGKRETGMPLSYVAGHGYEDAVVFYEARIARTASSISIFPGTSGSLRAVSRSTA